MNTSIRELLADEDRRWLHSDRLDLAVLPLDLELKKTLKLQTVSLDVVLDNDPELLSKVQLASFPFGVVPRSESGTCPVVVSLECNSIELDSPYTKKVDPVVLCSPSVAGGSSGGPVFLGDKLAAVFVGNLYDSSGAKLSKIVLAKHIIVVVKLLEKKNLGQPPAN